MEVKWKLVKIAPCDSAEVTLGKQTIGGAWIGSGRVKQILSLCIRKIPELFEMA